MDDQWPITTRGELGESVRVMKILVPLDGSRASEAALPKAVGLARQNAGARLVLVRAVDPATLPGVGFTAAHVSAINEAAEYLRNVAAHLRTEGIDVIGRSVWYAAAGPSIVEAARTVKPDVIVMVGSRADRLIPGAITELVLHGTRIPIVRVAAAKAPAGASMARATGRESDIKAGAHVA
jgi:nucleotide-binding universal stress UspA family protein